MSVYRHTELDLKKINYKKPEKQGLVYYSGIDYKNEPLYLQTPKLILTKSGLQTIESKNNNLELEPVNNDYSFYDTLLNLDELNVKRTFENNKEWFDKDIPLEVIDNMYKRNNKPVKKDSKPLFSFKVPLIKEKVQCQVFDQKKNTLDLKTIKEGTECICILHIKGLKFLKQHYYLDLYISQIKIFLEGDVKYNILENYSFNDIEEENNELKDLEQDLLLDEGYINSLRDKEEERKKIFSELEKYKNIRSETEMKISELEKQIELLE